MTGGERPGETLAQATFRATHLRPFRLTRRDGRRVVSIDVLPVAADTSGAGVRLETAWEPAPAASR